MFNHFRAMSIISKTIKNNRLDVTDTVVIKFIFQAQG